MEPKLIPDAPTDTGTNWIDDDGLLRDEGVIFGRAVGTADMSGEGGPLHWKLEAIRSHYRRQVASPEASAAGCMERIDILKQEQQEAQQAIAEAEEALATDGNEDAPQRVRDTVGFLFALIACVGMPVLVLDLLRPEAFEFPIVVAVVAATAGLFSLFQSRSVLFVSHGHLRSSPEQPETWKVYLTELLPPLAAAAFVATFAHVPGKAGATAAAFVFLAVVFWITGRLALSALPRIGAAAVLARRSRQHMRSAEEARTRLAAAEEALAKEQEQQRVHLIEIGRATHMADAKVALFLSEYELARRHAVLRNERAVQRAATAHEPPPLQPEILPTLSAEPAA